MVSRRWWMAISVLAGIAVVASSGCLSLELGKRHYEENPETVGRLRALETRVSALENLVAPSTTYPSTAPTPE